VWVCAKRTAGDHSAGFVFGEVVSMFNVAENRNIAGLSGAKLCNATDHNRSRVCWWCIGADMFCDFGKRKRTAAAEKPVVCQESAFLRVAQPNIGNLRSLFNSREHLRSYL
jgi:hypothetical protein